MPQFKVPQIPGQGVQPHELVPPELLAAVGQTALMLVARASYYDPEDLEQIGDLLGQVVAGHITGNMAREVIRVANEYQVDMGRMWGIPDLPFDVLDPLTYAQNFPRPKTAGCSPDGCGPSTGGRYQNDAGVPCCDECAIDNPCVCDGTMVGCDDGPTRAPQSALFGPTSNSDFGRCG